MRRRNTQALLRAALAEALPGVEVRTRVPDPRPDRLVVVRRTAGGEANALVDRAGVGVECWAPTEQGAWELADACSRALRRLRFADGYCSVEEESLRSDYDTVRGSPRWFGSYTVTTYATNE